MDPLNVLTEPSTDLERSPEDMLDDLETMVDALERKHGSLDEDVRSKVDDARKLVAQQSPLAKNTLEDAIVMCRERVTR